MVILNLLKVFFYKNFFKKVTQQYFSPYPIDLNDTIYMTHDTYNKNNYLSNWHFDQIHALKFFLYLEDTNESNGAFQYSLGSHHEGAYKGTISKIKNKEYIPNVVSSKFIKSGYSINGLAGDLIIFNTCGYHRGGIISKNKTRKIIRGHSHKIQNLNFLDKLFYRWRQSKLNLFQSAKFKDDFFFHVNKKYSVDDMDTSVLRKNYKVVKY